MRFLLFQYEFEFQIFLIFQVFPQRLRFSEGLQGFVDESIFDEDAVERIRHAPPMADRFNEAIAISSEVRF